MLLRAGGESNRTIPDDTETTISEIDNLNGGSPDTVVEQGAEAGSAAPWYCDLRLSEGERVDQLTTTDGSIRCTRESEKMSRVSEERDRCRPCHQRSRKAVREIERMILIHIMFLSPLNAASILSPHLFIKVLE